MSDRKIEKIDMRPSLGLELDYFEKKTYKPEYAVAEFVDNSVASYLNFRSILKFYDSSFKLKIDIVYDSDEKTLTITDNAAGMSEQTFKHALVLGNPPPDTSGLNQFGWGLKTAASWFGKKWSVRSTTFDSDYEFSAMVDIPELIRTGRNDVDIVFNKVDKYSHYTVVKITNLKKTIYKSNIQKLMLQLASLYRRFLVKKEITITFNGEELVYNDPEFLITKYNGEDIVWKKEFKDEVNFNGTRLPINGFIGLLKTGSYKEAGLTLIRRNRVIIGGYENGFKPREIYGSANSYQSLRLFGEINMDTWPVTQAKDDFDWDLNGLKEAFVEKIKRIAEEYISQAKTYRSKPEKNPVSVHSVQKIADETKRNIELMPAKAQVKISGELSPVCVQKDEDGLEIPSVTYPISIHGDNYNIKVEYICDPNRDLLSVSREPTEPNNMTLTFNTTFPMFNDLSTSPTFVKALQKFFIAYIISEEQTVKVSDTGCLIDPTDLRDNLNRTLIYMCNEGDFDND